jgi:hypothetical protein
MCDQLIMLMQATCEPPGLLHAQCSQAACKSQACKSQWTSSRQGVQMCVQDEEHEEGSQVLLAAEHAAAGRRRAHQVAASAERGTPSTSRAPPDGRASMGSRVRPSRGQRRDGQHVVSSKSVHARQAAKPDERTMAGRRCGVCKTRGRWSSMIEQQFVSVKSPQGESL